MSAERRNTDLPSSSSVSHLLDGWVTGLPPARLPVFPRADLPLLISGMTAEALFRVSLVGDSKALLALKRDLRPQTSSRFVPLIPFRIICHKDSWSRDCRVIASCLSVFRISGFGKKVAGNWNYKFVIIYLNKCISLSDSQYPCIYTQTYAQIYKDIFIDRKICHPFQETKEEGLCVCAQRSNRIAFKGRLIQAKADRREVWPFIKFRNKGPSYRAIHSIAHNYSPEKKRKLSIRLSIYLSLNLFIYPSTLYLFLTTLSLSFTLLPYLSLSSLSLLLSFPLRSNLLIPTWTSQFCPFLLYKHKEMK